LDSAGYINECCRRAVASIPPGSIDELLELIPAAERIFIYGSGRSGLVGQLFGIRLVQMGLDVHFVGDMTTPIISRDDLTILISNTGYTFSVVQTAEIARRIGSHVVAVTSSPSSKLAHISNSKVVMTIPKDCRASEIAPLGTVFEDGILLLFDSLVPELMARLGVTEDDMRRRHAIWV
jgi:6-phospho-3-hexuloisomerase